MTTLTALITEWLEPKLRELGAYVVEVRQHPAQQRIEVYLDREAVGTGIDLDTCAEVSRFLQFQLDHSDQAPRNYILEVSSPGMDNPFKVLRQYQKYRGTPVDVLLLDGRKFSGVLVDADQTTLTLDRFIRPPESGPSTQKKKPVNPETERVTLLFEQIKSTKRKFDF